MWHPESVYDETGHLDEGVVHAWLDGALVEDAGREVAAHAAACESCAARVAEARGLIAGASRVLGVLDGAIGDTASGVEGRGSGAPRGAVSPGAAVTPIPARRPPNARTRWSTRRISLAAAAVFVFAAAGVVLREGVQGDELREAVTASAPDLFNAPPERGGAGGAAEVAVGRAGGDAATTQATEPVEAPALPTPVPAPNPGLRSAAPAQASPPVRFDRAPAAPVTGVASGALADQVMPPAARAVAGKAAARAPSSVAEAAPEREARLRADETAEARQAKAAPPPAMAAAPGAGAADVAAAPLGRAKLGDRALALEAVTVTAAPAQRAGNAYLTPQTVAQMAGCWRLSGTDTLFRFPVTPLDSVAAGAWFEGVRIAGGERAALRWRRMGGEPNVILVQVAGEERQLRLGAGVDSLAANRARSDVRSPGPGVLAREPDSACP